MDNNAPRLGKMDKAFKKLPDQEFVSSGGSDTGDVSWLSQLYLREKLLSRFSRTSIIVR